MPTYTKATFTADGRDPVVVHGVTSVYHGWPGDPIPFPFGRPSLHIAEEKQQRLTVSSTDVAAVKACPVGLVGDLKIVGFHAGAECHVLANRVVVADNPVMNPQDGRAWGDLLLVSN